MFLYRFVRDAMKFGLVEGWKQQDSYTKWLLIIFVLLIAYKPVISVLGISDA